MHTELYVSLVIEVAPSINEIVKTACMAFTLRLLARYCIIEAPQLRGQDYLRLAFS